MLRTACHPTCCHAYMYGTFHHTTYRAEFNVLCRTARSWCALLGVSPRQHSDVAYTIQSVCLTTEPPPSLPPQTLISTMSVPGLEREMVELRGVTFSEGDPAILQTGSLAIAVHQSSRESPHLRYSLSGLYPALDLESRLI